MKYFKYLGGFLLLAVLVSGFYLARSTEAAVTKEALTKAAKGDFSALSKQARAANELTITSAGAQTIVVTRSTESQYRKQYPWLDSTHEVNITAPADKDIYVHYAYGLEYLNNTRDVYTNSARTVIATTTATKHLMVYYGDTSGNQYAYLVPKGQTRYFKMTHRADTAELFKGVYSNYLKTIYYVYSPNIDDSSVFMAQTGKYLPTNTVSVVGEKSPYIMKIGTLPVGPAIPVQAGQWISIWGTEILASDIYLDGKMVTDTTQFKKINSPTEVKEIQYHLPTNLAAGTHTLHLNSVIFGKSNTVWLDVSAPVAPSINVSVVNTSAIKEHSESNPSADLGRFEINYDVRAVNGDVYLKAGGSTRGQTHQQSTSANYLVLYGANNIATTTGQATSALTRVSGGTVVGDRIKITAGSSARFNLTTSFDPSYGGIYKVGLHSVNFAANQTDPLTQLVLTPATNYRTNGVVIDDRLSGGSGIQIVYISSDTNILDSNGDTPGGEQARYIMVFDVEAFGGHVYLPAGATVSTSTVDVDDTASYAIENSNGQQIPINFSGQASSTAALSSTAEVSGNYYLLQEGETERFTLSVDFNPKVDGFYRLQLYGLNYRMHFPHPANNMERALPENTFQTNFVNLNATEIARRQGLMASAWEAIQGFLVRVAVGR